ncbi:hypothetical protein Tco_0325109 [Tanacetum coccineum]
MASQDARLSKFKADFKQQQSEMTNKINTVLKTITDQITRALPSDTVNSINVITICPKQPDISRNNNPRGEEQEEKDNPENINTNPSSLPDPSVSFVTEKVHKLNSFLESFSLVPQSPDTKFVCIKKDDGDVMFIEIIKKYIDSREEELEEDENMMTGEMGVEYFDIFFTRSELAYHKYLMSGVIPSLFLRNPIIVGGSPSNLKYHAT